MGTSTPTGLVERAREAVARGDWAQAHGLLAEADAGAALADADLSLLADVAYAAGRLDVTVDTWERAYAQHLRANDPLAAAGAAVRVAMHLLFDTALMAPVRGWLRRAEQLVDPQAQTAVHAWLAVVRNYERLLSGDFANARHWARRAIAVGTHSDPAAAALGRIAEARSLVLDGEVAPGLELLSEAGVAAISGELPPLFTGLVYCELVCAYQALAQYDLAEQWTTAMEQWCRGHAIGSLHGRCRVHRAEILRLRGCCAEAEAQALLAVDELQPYLRRELGWPLTELGRIRLRRGNLDGAQQALHAAHELGWDAQPGLALVQLARGDVGLAAQGVGDALDNPLNVPSKEFPPHTELRRAPLLEAQVEIGVAARDLNLARTAADELSRIAALFDSQALLASAAHAHACVSLAEGDAAAARRDFAAARDRWNEIGAPYETAQARMGLGRALRAAANEPAALLEFRAARATFDRIGAGHQAAAAAQACGDTGTVDAPGHERRPGSVPPADPQAQDARVFRREDDGWCLRFQQHTVRLRSLKGLDYLARLLAHPGRELHVLDLVAAATGGRSDVDVPLEAGLSIRRGLDAGVVLDAQAKQAYRRRLAEIDEDREEALVAGDLQRAEQAEVERDFLVRELARALGLGGRDRRAVSVCERARASVTRAIRHAMARIAEYHPALFKHLQRTIRTGTYCAYLPDPEVSAPWQQ